MSKTIKGKVQVDHKHGLNFEIRQYYLTHTLVPIMFPDHYATYS